MDQLREEILQYETQLAQVHSAASELPEGPDKDNLTALEEDLKEIINLSKKNLEEVSKESSENDPLANEYDLFKAELEKLDYKNVENQKQTSPAMKTSLVDIKSDLEGLKGTKCQAPFMYRWADTVSYHNAFISHVPQPEDLNDYENIEVKVMFTNPTHKEMLPCPYYLEGDCKFSDDKCRYSHGELVLLSSLKEYREPDFSKLSSGCKAFAKLEDGLWYRAQIIEVNENNCSVKLESNLKEQQISFHNIFPLGKCFTNFFLFPNRISFISKHNVHVIYDDEVCDTSSSSSESEDEFPKEDNDELVRRILNAPPTSALGEWEKFTKGFGSKIMAKMGYIHGSGLGKNGMGRVEPVPAVILPAGKSLDHCMLLKEKAGNDKDLFKAERKLKHLQRKHEEKVKKLSEAEKGKTDIFTFLNTTLDSSRIPEAPKTKIKNEYKNETTRNLNVTGLQIAEEARRVEKEIKSLNQSLARHTPNTHPFNVIKEKLACKENRLSQLQASEKKIRIEQDQRRDRRKLTVF